MESWRQRARTAELSTCRTDKNCISNKVYDGNKVFTENTSREIEKGEIVRRNVAPPEGITRASETRQTIITSGEKHHNIVELLAHVVSKRYIYGPVGIAEP